MAKVGKVFYPNMDIARYLMALAVVVAHYNTLAGHSIPFPISSFEGVGGFFALSGFLMYPSFKRATGVAGYVRSRARRILPPYFFVVLFFAVVLVFAGNLSPVAYFSDSGFWKYLIANLAFLNWLHPDLPGVFQGAGYEMSAVNGSLWTMKVEWCLYLSVPVVMWIITRFRLNRGITAAIIVIGSCIYRFVLVRLHETTGSEIYYILGRQFFGQLAYFYMGMIIYFYKDYIFDRRIGVLIIGLILCFVSRFVPYGDIFIAPVVIPLAVLAFSMLKTSSVRTTSRYNLSYNIYLFHFPIIQLSIFTGVNTLPKWISFPAVISATVLLAVISIRIIEPLALRGIRSRC